MLIRHLVDRPNRRTLLSDQLVSLVDKVYYEIFPRPMISVVDYRSRFHAPRPRHKGIARRPDHDRLGFDEFGDQSVGDLHRSLHLLGMLVRRRECAPDPGYVH
jgi:hypothetical protein